MFSRTDPADLQSFIEEVRTGYPGGALIADRINDGSHYAVIVDIPSNTGNYLTSTALELYPTATFMYRDIQQELILPQTVHLLPQFAHDLVFYFANEDSFMPDHDSDYQFPDGVDPQSPEALMELSCYLLSTAEDLPRDKVDDDSCATWAEVRAAANAVGGPSGLVTLLANGSSGPPWEQLRDILRGAAATDTDTDTASAPAAG